MRLQKCGQRKWYHRMIGRTRVQWSGVNVYMIGPEHCQSEDTDVAGGQDRLGREKGGLPHDWPYQGPAEAGQT